MRAALGNPISKEPVQIGIRVKPGKQTAAAGDGTSGNGLESQSSHTETLAGFIAAF